MAEATVVSMDLETVRKISRFTQAQVAAVLDVSLPTYMKMEKHPERIKIEDARKLAGLFNVSVQQIFFGKEL